MKSICLNFEMSFFFLAFDFCRSCVFSSLPQQPMTSDFEGFLSQILSITFFVLSSFFRKSQYFPVQCWLLNKGTTGTIFITSLVWPGPWLEIEPRTSPTLSQHSTTRLSRRRFWNQYFSPFIQQEMCLLNKNTFYYRDLVC